MSYEDPFNSNSAPNGDDTSSNFYKFNNEGPADDFLEQEEQELGDTTGNDETSNANNTSLTNGTQSSNQTDTPYQALSQLDEQMNEPEKMQKWREEFSSRITKKDTDEESKRKEMREQAKKELDDFYKQRVEQMERTKGENRVNNRTLENDLLKNGTPSSAPTSNGKDNDWDKITSLCEFNPKNNRSQKDLTRYRSVLLQLKQQQQTGSK